MSETTTHHTTSSRNEHRTTQSYIIGFLLSLVFTVIPYSLVVQKLLTGTTLLIAILVIAVLQMLVQIFFFLHLGRGPKPLYNIAFFAFTASTIIVVVGGSIFIMNNLYAHMAGPEITKRLAQDEAIAQIGGEKTGACQELHTNHKVSIINGAVSPQHLEAKLCDTLTFINYDDSTREIGFGSHPNHTGYAGQDDLLLYKGRGTTLTLNEAGSFFFHDHLHPTVTGDFTVTDKE